MSELEQLEERIVDSEHRGVETAHIQDDYAPCGGAMIQRLTDSGEFVARRVKLCSGLISSSTWRIFKAGFEPF